MKPILSLFALLFGLFIQSASAQQLTQTIRGTITDKQSKESLIGATVVVVGSSPTLGAASDMDGKYVIKDVPIGRQTLVFKYMGYREVTVQVILTSGKEAVLNPELEESVIEGKEVTIVAERRKDKAVNEMTSVSARSFTTEETSRYAGSLNDPSRMASNYAGVSGANDARNDIIIRGNSPTGLLWRLNGINIPNPNHFGSLGTTGGPVSMLNNNLLDNSDFMTGAFPAEYGNAVAGVFDLNLRSGNSEKHEFTGQVGFNGFEIGAEGPLNKKHTGSYLIGYRYSTLGVFKAMGIDFGTGAAIPQYQDLTLKVDLNTGKKGKLSLFAIGGKSYIEVLMKEEDTASTTNLYALDNINGYYGSTMGVVGLSHTYFWDSKSWSKLSVALSGTAVSLKQDSVPKADFNNVWPYYRNTSNQSNLDFNYSYNRKFSSRDYWKSGVSYTLQNYHYIDSVLDGSKFRTLTQFDGNSGLVQAYSQWQHKFTDKLTLTGGLHYQLYTFNTTQALEPRIGLRWEYAEGKSISFGSGMHSQTIPMYALLGVTTLDDGTEIRTNDKLGFTKSAHFVVAYDWSIRPDLRFKAEAYYQHVYNVPVEQRATSFSLLNSGADFGIDYQDSLTNEGTGKNYGLELTLEKFFSRGYYYLFTTSLFDSRYKGSDDVDRNTAFNGHYVVNALAGKEWTIHHKNTLTVSLKSTFAGGKRYTPVDEAYSQLTGKTEYDKQRAYSLQYKDYFRTDLKIAYRKNGKKITQEWALDIDNIFNSKNIWQQVYDPKSNTYKTEYQIGFFPIPQYKIEF